MASIVLSECIPGFRRTQFRHTANASGTRFLNLNLSFPVQENQVPKTFFCAVIQVQDIAVRLDFPGQDTEESKLPHMRVNHGFEYKCRRGAVFGRFHDRAVAGDTRAFQRTLADIDDSVHHLADADILCDTAGENRNQGAALERIMESAQDFRLGKLFSAEIKASSASATVSSRTSLHFAAMSFRSSGICAGSPSTLTTRSSFAPLPTGRVMGTATFLP